VVDADGKAIGTVRHVVLHPDTRQVAGIVVHQGVMKTRELVVPLDKIASAGPPVRLTMRAADLETLPLFRGEPLRPMPDHWDMPIGFDERAFFLIGGIGWTGAVLPFVRKSPVASGTPVYVEDKNSVRDAPEPEIARGMPVYDSLGQRVGDVESVSIDPATKRITWVVVRRGHLFARETTIPASMIQSVTDRITLNAPAQSLRRLEPAGT
jgi:sporulation protein YlmC with PRC-barrel domain